MIEAQYLALGCVFSGSLYHLTIEKCHKVSISYSRLRKLKYRWLAGQLKVAQCERSLNHLPTVNMNLSNCAESVCAQINLELALVLSIQNIPYFLGPFRTRANV